MESTFEKYVRDLVRELHPDIQVEFLPVREVVYADPIYPVHFQTGTASLTVGFPSRMVLFPEGKAEVYETVARVVRLLPYFQRHPSPWVPSGGRSDAFFERH